jgi:hypothetical protein
MAAEDGWMEKKATGRSGPAKVRASFRWNIDPPQGTRMSSRENNWGAAFRNDLSEKVWMACGTNGVYSIVAI